MMKKVSGTENELSRFVVNMVGCVTEREPLLLVLEYAKYGDLLTYLKSMRNHVKVNLNDFEGLKIYIFLSF